MIGKSFRDGRRLEGAGQDQCLLRCSQSQSKPEVVGKGRRDPTGGEGKGQA